MSLQLIVYPQSYEGQFNTISMPSFNQYVSDFSFSNGAVGNGYSLTTADPVGTVMSNLAPNNLWNTWRSTGGVWGSISAPVLASNKVTLDSASSASSTGIFQLISNLIIGSVYELKVDILAGTTGSVIIGHGTSWFFSGSNYEPILFQSFTPSVATHTFTFTATKEDMVLILNYLNDDNTNLEIGSVSIKEAPTSAATTYEYTDGSVIVDLYSDETIPLTLSIDNFKNIAEKTQSYSKSFDLPATKRNNKIFSSLFDVTRSVKSDVYAFNPYRKTKVILKEDGHTIFDGYLRLIEIKEKDEEISYTVNLYSDTITLADTLKDKKFKDIDFGELTHNYNKTNIKNTFTSTGVTYENSATSGFRTSETVKYPFCKWNGNIYKDSGNIKLTSLEDAFRPFINCKYILDRIITEAGFTYSSDFLNTTDFTKLYIDFNWGADNQPTHVPNILWNAKGYTENFATTSYTSLEVDYWNNGLTTTNAPSQWSDTDQEFTASINNQKFEIYYNYKLENTSASSAHSYTARWIHKDSSGNVLEEIDLTTESISIGGTDHYTGHFHRLLQSGDTLAPEFLADTAAKIKQPSGSTPSQYHAGTETSQITVFISILSLAADSVLMALRGDLGQFEYLKGLFTMFNLLILKDNDDPTNLIIEPYKSVFVDDSLSQYITINTHDWTDKVDISQIQLKTIDTSKTVMFNFVQEDNDYAKKVYKSTTGYEYGSQEIDATDFTILEGESEIQATPFAATFVKPIFDNFTTEMTIPVIYKGADDGSFTGYENKPRILYNVGEVTMSNKTYYIPAQNGLASENQSKFLQFSHLTETPTTLTTKDYNFNTRQLINSIGNVPIDNLFNTYWLPYYDQLYNADTRTMSLKVYLTPSEIANFNFYDKVTIKNREYRVNKIQYKPYELSTVEFILIT
tara:strand:+ start:133 stop:2868 length:2736 start_codon:yes stop_codon:yes gene_type:complete